MKSQAVEACRHPEAGDLSGISKLLDETWHLKKQLASRVSNGVIKEMYRAVRQAGALGGKISGAGGRGFLLLFCSHQYQDKVRQALAGLKELTFNLENEGPKVIFNYQR